MEVDASCKVLVLRIEETVHDLAYMMDKTTFHAKHASKWEGTDHATRERDLLCGDWERVRLDEVAVVGADEIFVLSD